METSFEEMLKGFDAEMNERDRQEELARARRILNNPASNSFEVRKALINTLRRSTADELEGIGRLFAIHLKVIDAATVRSFYEWQDVPDQQRDHLRATLLRSAMGISDKVDEGYSDESEVSLKFHLVLNSVDSDPAKLVAVAGLFLRKYGKLLPPTVWSRVQEALESGTSGHQQATKPLTGKERYERRYGSGYEKGQVQSPKKKVGGGRGPGVNPEMKEKLESSGLKKVFPRLKLDQPTNGSASRVSNKDQTSQVTVN